MLTLCGLHYILDLLDKTLDLLAGALQLLLVALQVLAKGRAVRQTLGELERLQAHAHDVAGRGPSPSHTLQTPHHHKLSPPALSTRHDCTPPAHFTVRTEMICLEDRAIHKDIT